MQIDEPTFSDLKVTRQFINAMEDLGYETPTEIQVKAIRPILAGQDVIGIAQTGTGKTAAFVVPLLQKVKYAQGHDPRALIMVPTRELAVQMEKNVTDLASYTDLRVVCLYGGGAKTTQAKLLAAGCDIVVATPGRLMEMYLSQKLILKKIKTLVLDEADRMMDMGFIDQLRDLLEVIPSKRQNLLFSATFSDRVEQLTHEFLEYAVRIEAAPQATPAETVDQQLYHLPNFKTKLLHLETLLGQEEFSRVLVFCRTKERADRVHRYLDRKLGEEVKVIHSNKAQTSRINAFKAFQQGELRVLVATDITARGVDISDVSHVVNFDVPYKVEDYTHRIGRTGRARRSGVAITFADESEKFQIQKIEGLIGAKIPTYDLPEGVEIQEWLPGEKTAFAREIDRQKQILDPTFQGAFHERKRKKKKKGRR